jgi:hypothetical protein
MSPFHWAIVIVLLAIIVAPVIVALWRKGAGKVLAINLNIAAFLVFFVPTFMGGFSTYQTYYFTAAGWILWGTALWQALRKPQVSAEEVGKVFE